MVRYDRDQDEFKTGRKVTGVVYGHEIDQVQSLDSLNGMPMRGITSCQSA
jgi:hypothetical protein